MKRYVSQRILRCGLRVFLCLLGSGLALNAQQFRTASGGGGGPGITLMATGSGSGSGQGGFSTIISGSDIGAVILNTCDLNHDGTVSLAELKEVAAGCFKLWDTNNDGNLSQDELSAALKQLFLTPPPGGAQGMAAFNASAAEPRTGEPPGGPQGMAVVNRVAVQVPPDETPTPDKQVAKHIMALADINKDGLLSLQELNDWLDKSFSQWDQNGDAALDVSELDAAFGQLARPD